MPDTSMIEVDNVIKRYGSTEALKNLSFKVPHSQVIGFLGPNGAGKSTTMRILAGSLRPSSGRAFIAGIDVQEDPVMARKRIGYLPENNPLYEDMMVVEFLHFAAAARNVPKRERASLIQQAVEACGLTQVISKDIGQLSRGYRQRVGLAQAILHKPDLLILDEPTSGLDPNQIVEIRNLIKKLGQEKTVILSTHMLHEVQTTCTRVLIINNGQLVADDTPEQLTAATDGSGEIHAVLAPRQNQPFEVTRVRELLAAIPGVVSLENAEAEGPDTAGFRIRFHGDDIRLNLFDVVVQHNLTLLALRRTHASLEDTFRKLTDTQRAA